MDTGIAQTRLPKFEPFVATAYPANKQISVLKIIDHQRSTNRDNSCLAPSSRQALENVELSRVGHYGTDAYEKETGILPYNHTTRTPHGSPERSPPDSPLHSYLPELSTDLDQKVVAKPWASFEMASTLFLESRQISPERENPAISTASTGINSPKMNAAQLKLLSNVRWDQIRELRTEVLSLRSQVHQLRTVLRRKQDAKSAAYDIAFRRMQMQAMDVLITEYNLPSKGHKTIEQLMQDCQDAQDEYGPLEDDCNQLEAHLSSREFRLTQLEDLFYSQSKRKEYQAPEQDTQDKQYTRGIVPDPEVRAEQHDDVIQDITDLQFHPLVAQYLSKLGDLDLAQESLDDCVEQKEALEAEKDSRLRSGLALDPDDQTWLDNSHQEYGILLSKISSLEAEVEAMKRECHKRGLVDEYGDPTTFREQEEGAFKSEEVLPGNHASGYVKYPLLLPHPGTDQDELRDYNPRPDERSDLTTNRINSWILSQLRTSALDVNLLASIFECSIGKTNDEWQFSVLLFWYEDDTAKDNGGLKVHTGSLTTEAGPMLDLSDSEDGEVIINHYYSELGGQPHSSCSDSSDITEIAGWKGKPPTSQKRGLFWNSD